MLWYTLYIYLVGSLGTPIPFNSTFIIVTKHITQKPCLIMGGSRGGDRESRPPPPLKNYKAIGILSNTGPDSLEYYKATKPAVNVQPLSARQQNAI